MAMRFNIIPFDYQSTHIVFFSETAPTQGTLKVFPDIILSNAYIILRPFFRPIVSADSGDVLDAKNWEFGEISHIWLLFILLMSAL